MGRAGYCYREVVPFTVMVMAECTNVGLSTIFKAATNEGLSYLVFMVYSYVISTLFLLPIAFFFHRKTELPRFTSSLALKMMLLGALGFTAQLSAYKGIEYASPTLCSAMNNLTPASTFVLAIIFSLGAPRLNLLRATQTLKDLGNIIPLTEKLALRRISSVAKIIGTMVSITGALVVVLYKGPQIFRFNHLSPITISLYSQFNSPTSTQSNWSIGGALLAANSLIISIWYIFQAKTLKEYPAELLVVFYYNLSCTIISTPLCLLAQPNSSAWKIKPNIRLVAILYGGIIGSLDTTVHAWAIHVKGPVYVAMFKPFSIAIAAIMGVIFLGDSLYLGSIVGAVIISFGFYVVMWGKVQEEVDEVDHVEVCNTELSSKEPVPLLKRLH